MVTSSLVVVCALAGSLTEKELKEKTVSGFEQVIAARRKWRFEAKDIRLNPTSGPSEFTATDSYNGKEGIFLLARSWQLDGRRFERVKAVNSRYGFDIARSGGDPWELKSLEGEQSGGAYRKIANDNELETLLAPEYAIFIHKWNKLVSEPSMKITRSEHVGDLLKLSFSVSGPMYRGNRVVGGEVLINPTYWGLQKYEAVLEFSSGTKARYLGETQYEGAIDAIPVVRKHEYKTIDDKSGQVRFSRTFNYDGAKRGDLSEKLARSSYYGFPEPELGEDRYPVWAVLIALGVGCIALGAWFKRRKALA